MKLIHGTYFFNQLNKYAQVDWIKANSITEYKEKLKEYELTIIGFHKSNANPWKEYKFSDHELTKLYEISRTNKVILDVFTRPYAINDIQSFSNINGILLGCGRMGKTFWGFQLHDVIPR